ncbi:hypothetical protein CY652_07810 [Burkholderia sp. WAC0059]|nr:hypothetical protein CY652_07810 [Burkholderia sp. WAC0059]
MAVSGFDKYLFGTRLNEVLFASQPIQSVEHLFGRQQELDRIEKALFASGRHILSTETAVLANRPWLRPAANQYQSADSQYIDVGCGPDATLAVDRVTFCDGVLHRDTR